MRAVRLYAPGEGLRLEDVPVPDPAGTEVLVRVAGAGVCHTDVLIADGAQTRVELPVTLGHEIAGRVVGAGPDAVRDLETSGLAIDDAIAVFGGWGCGECRDCRAGAEQRCAASTAPGFQADGGYAEFVLIPHPRHLVPIGALDPSHAAPLTDAAVTPYRAMRRAERWLRPGARVLVIGCGALGQFALQLLRLVPDSGEHLRIVVRELDPRRLERATELGADLALLDGDAAMTRDALGGPADVVLDFVGADATLAVAAGVLAADGVLVLVGESGGGIGFGFDVVPVEAWLTTVAWGSLQDLRDVVALARRGRIQWRTEKLPLEDATAAHARLRDGDVDGRLVLVP